MTTTCLICGIQDKPCRCATERALEERTKEILEMINEMTRITSVQNDSLNTLDRNIRDKYGL